MSVDVGVGEGVHGRDELDLRPRERRQLLAEPEQLVLPGVAGRHGVAVAVEVGVPPRRREAHGSGLERLAEGLAQA